MASIKLNPQPEPPSGIFDILNWLGYIFDWIYWIVSIPFYYFF